MKIGFIGLGRMGSAMAANLVKAGFDVTVFNRNPQKAASLVDKGARLAGGIAEASQADVVITMLANDDAVRDIVLGEDGIVASLPAGAIHVSMSTISVSLVEDLARAHASAGQRFVSAPVFGRPEAAATAKLFIVVGTDSATLAVCQPLFDVLGQKTFPVGKVPQVDRKSVV